MIDPILLTERSTMTKNLFTAITGRSNAGKAAREAKRAGRRRRREERKQREDDKAP